MDLKLRGKRALVTGGSQGIGLSVARSLADEGADVMIAARGRNGLKEAVASTPAAPGRMEFIEMDTTDDHSIRAAFGETADRLGGGLDILVNGAANPGGPASSSSLSELADDDLRREMETKVLGYLRTARAAAPYMLASGWGRIINISGLAARQTGSTFGSVRNVSVVALTKSLADELGPAGINVTVVHPGLTITERMPDVIRDFAERNGIDVVEATASLAGSTTIGRLVTAEEVAHVITFLASPLSVAVNGDVIAVGGGSPGAIHY